MFLAGCLLALFSGLANAGAAALEKREGMAVGGDPTSFGLMVALLRRPWWCLAMGVSVVAWLAEAAALVLAPLAAVAPLRGAGRSVLVVVGVRWLGERFGSWELAGVGLAMGGAVLAATTATTGGSVAPLSSGVLVLVGVVALLVAAALAWLAGAPGYGAAAGTLFTATAIYTKEVGDHFASGGPWRHHLLQLLASPSPWGLILLTVVAQVWLQRAFRTTNAASVAAANAAVSTVGLVIAGFTLYQQPFPTGLGGPVLAAGILASTVGAMILAAGGRRVVVN